MSWPSLDLGATFVHSIDRGLATLSHAALELWSTSPLLMLGVAAALLITASMARPNRV